MAFHYSRPFEALLDAGQCGARPRTARVLIVGSGYGGSVAALRLSQCDRRDRDHGVLVLERGREYALGEFPNSMDELPGHLRVRRGQSPQPSGNEDALFDLHVGTQVDVLVGSGLGGTSLVNANVAIEPDRQLFAEDGWPDAIRREAASYGTSTLAAAFRAVYAALDVTKMSGELPAKARAFERFAKSLGLEPERAPIAVNFTPGKRNAMGVLQDACTSCGNCVTGCNVGAKSTLAMNLIPAARALGVEFFTGAHVLSLRPLDADAPGTARWAVRLRATSRTTRSHSPGEIEIYADFVILAAGTLGSTEILQRSKNLGLLQVSDSVGDRFSTNGDAMGASFAGRDPVRALGHFDYWVPGDCGPTITTCARGTLGDGRLERSFILEDAAIPAGLVEVFGEVVTTVAQAGRLGRNRLPGWLAQHPEADPLAVHPAAIEGSQMFLAMSRDAACGRLQFEPAYAAADDTGAVPYWPHVGPGDGTLLGELDAMLAKQDRARGLDHAQYLANPLWRPLPAEFNSLGGPPQPGRLITVHPLGGCPMADDGARGVVNHLGQVFRGNGDALHDGLYVLDGAIVPTSLGVNPFLTIAALAWRACEELRATQNWAAPPAELAHLPPPPRHPRAAPTQSPAPAPLVVREQLLGRLERPADEIERRLLSEHESASRWFERDGLILQLRTGCPERYAGQAGIQGRGTSDAERRIPVCATLYENLIPAHRAERARMHGSPREHLRHRPIATGSGTITILAPDRPAGALDWLARTSEALLTYRARRGSVRALRRGTSDRSTTLGEKIDGVRAFLNLASMHATYREFAYELVLDQVPVHDGSEPILKPLPNPIRVRGTKRLAWRRDSERLWQSLLRLPARFSIEKLGLDVAATFDVDTGYLVSDGLLQLAPGAGDSVPYGLLGVTGFATRFARSVLQAGFWEFGAPDYPEQRPAPEPELLPRLPDGTPLESRTLCVRHSAHSSAHLPLRLHRYGSKARKPPVLLIHGLAQGSLIYAHPAQHGADRRHLASYLSEQGYDVWLIDYRLSNQFGPGVVKYDGWTLDEIAEYDIPAAVKAIHEYYGGGERLHVFAHCVGAVGIAAAILSGRVNSTQVASVALNAIHPWILPSPANDFRARLGVFVRDWLDDSFFDPLPASRNKVGGMHALLDRLAFSLARLGEAPGTHPSGPDADYADAICDRMTLLYGRMWRHENSRAVHPHWQDLVGRAPGAVQRHLFHLLTNRRVLGRDGDNRYLTESNLKQWEGIRTLLMHGDRSDVFNPQSATRTAIRLSQMLGAGPGTPTPVCLKRVADYGHMDVILADDALHRSFPYLHHFFRGDFDTGREVVMPDGRCLRLDPIDADDDPHGVAKLPPNVGPILRGARLQDGRLQLRIWAEMPTMNTSRMQGVRVVSPAGATIIGGEPYSDEQYYWLDVELAPAEYDEVVLSSAVASGGKGISSWPLRRPLAMRSVAAAASPALPPSGVTPRALPTWLTRLQARVSGQPVADCHFLVGSCRYPGTPFDRDIADGAFRRMLQIIDSDTPCDALFLIGDQIYADATAGLLDPASWRDRFEQRHRDALSGAHIRDVLRSIPVHFAVDDHEFADNFAGPIDPPTPVAHYAPWQENAVVRRIKAGLLVKNSETPSDSEYDFAVQVAERYQGSARAQRPFGTPRGAGRFWYPLEHGNEFPCPAFILDTRSERTRAAAGQPARLMSDAQLGALKSWLESVHRDHPEKPKFIFSGSVIAPLVRDAHHDGMWRREDGLAGYPEELEQIVAHIVKDRVQHVVFVGGDLHLSCGCRLWLSKGGDEPVEALQIVASGLYAPLPFANLSPHDIDWGKRCTIPLPNGHAIDYEAQRLSSARSHFVQVGAQRQHSGQWQLTLTAHETDAMEQTPTLAFDI